MKRLFVVLAVACAAGLSGAAVASVLATSPTPAPSSEPAASSDHPGQGQEHEREAKREHRAKVDHSGSIARFESASSCALVEVSSLPAGWNHGDYVSAVAADGTTALVTQAAHSDCGKPMTAVRSGGGPPAWAVANGAAGQASAGDAAGS